MICDSIVFVKSSSKLFIVLYMQKVFTKLGSRQNIEKKFLNLPQIFQNQDSISLANLLNFEVKLSEIEKSEDIYTMKRDK